MKGLFYSGLLGLFLFEVMNVYFIMPMPGSQEINSIDFAYFLYTWRWIFRAVFTILILLGMAKAFSIKRKWKPIVFMVLTGTVVYMFNFVMIADQMFKEPENLVFEIKNKNVVPEDRLVIGIENNGEAKAYPIEFLAYHHKIQDVVGGKKVMVTYCSVCRTGRVFEPLVQGRFTGFRLVGMDHYNAMFEDELTRSWWRQANGEAIKGELKGELLPEISSVQMTLIKWFETYPNGKVMQPDIAFLQAYDSLANFEKGKSKSSLTKTDTASWENKSWIVGLQVGEKYKAYDWNDLKKYGIINDEIGDTPVVLVLSTDGNSFAAFERPTNNFFKCDRDTLFLENESYSFSGIPSNASLPRLKRIQAYQEFWHSWRTFHPNTSLYSPS